MADFGDADLDGDLSLGFSTRRDEPRVEKKKLDEEPDGDLASMRFDMEDEDDTDAEPEGESHDIYSQVNASTATITGPSTPGYTVPQAVTSPRRGIRPILPISTDYVEEPRQSREEAHTPTEKTARLSSQAPRETQEATPRRTPSHSPSNSTTSAVSGEHLTFEEEFMQREGQMPFTQLSEKEIHQKQPHEKKVSHHVRGPSDATTDSSRSETSEEEDDDDEGEWQDMLTVASYDVYDDRGNVVVKNKDALEVEEVDPTARSGYTRVTRDEDAKSINSMDENTSYLFDDDEMARNPLSQMQATKGLLSDSQRIGYVGLCKLMLIEMARELASLKGSKKIGRGLSDAQGSMAMWSQKMMFRLYSHMELSPEEQIMIEQLYSHGVEPRDITPSLIGVKRVKNPLNEENQAEMEAEEEKKKEEKREEKEKGKEGAEDTAKDTATDEDVEPSSGETEVEVVATEVEADTETIAEGKPSFDGSVPDINEDATKVKIGGAEVAEETEDGDLARVETQVAESDAKKIDDSSSTHSSTYSDEYDDRVYAPEELEDKKMLTIDIRWTLLCDLFLVLVADSVYDARSRTLMQKVGEEMGVTWLEMAQFEQRVTDALEMEENTQQTWDEKEIMKTRKKKNLRKKYMYVGLATLGGGLVVGLSGGLLAPVIGAGLAAGFTTIGITGTGAFLGGIGGAAVVTTAATALGARVGSASMMRRMGSVKTFEFKPLHNQKRLNLIITISGWMLGKEDDVRLPFSTVDPIMGDLLSVLWEPEMLQSMGQTINILATEVLANSIQQVLGATVLTALMSSIQLPMILTKLGYLVDNPWNVSLDRAWATGYVLADTLIQRNLGVRPATLVGFSLGARVIYSCLVELARRGAYGLVQDVYIFGAPVIIKSDQLCLCRSMVSGRFVNGYSRKDWVLGYLFRATSGGLGRVAGLTKLESVEGIENYDATDRVDGHMAYRKAMPQMLKDLGWEVLSEDFAEIEDPDPEKHRERQRELIQEFDIARKQMEAELKLEEEKESKEKKKKGFFGSWKKKQPKKKSWWDMTSKVAEDDINEGNITHKDGEEGEEGEEGKEGEEGTTPDSTNPEGADNTLFDLDAIQREVLRLENDPKLAAGRRGSVPDVPITGRPRSGTNGSISSQATTFVEYNPTTDGNTEQIEMSFEPFQDDHDDRVGSIGQKISAGVASVASTASAGAAAVANSFAGEADSSTAVTNGNSSGAATNGRVPTAATAPAAAAPPETPFKKHINPETNRPKSQSRSPTPKEEEIVMTFD
ncbi:putative membrane protein [Yarrowia sp. B02]|nr:putative membrane protein [Yarrowia sp. B02]